METFIGQIIALATFFAFPAIQYYLLKRFSKKHGNPELWYLPSYGFRLVISNIPNRRTLSDLRHKSILRKIIPSNDGSTVSTLIDEKLLDKDEFFLFGGYDEILICFKIDDSNKKDVKFILTDKLGNGLKEFSFSNFHQIISDYTANIENYLNFDIKVAKRVILKTNTLLQHWNTIKGNNNEQNFLIDRVRDVG